MNAWAPRKVGMTADRLEPSLDNRSFCGNLPVIQRRARLFQLAKSEIAISYFKSLESLET